MFGEIIANADVIGYEYWSDGIGIIMRKLISVAIYACLMAGCGGDSPSDPDGSGNGTMIKINGPVDTVSYSALQLGVNGHELDASEATVTYDDQSFSFDTVVEGARVEISSLSGLAQAIGLQPAVAGQITSVSVDKVTVNGVTFNFATRGLSVGDWVMVFAQTQPDASWAVSAITAVEPLLNAEIEGAVSALGDNGNSTFMLGSVLVDFSNASIEDGRTLANGMWLEVFGQFTNGVFVASFIDIRDNQDFSGLELEGIVTWVSDDKSVFEVAGHLLVNVNSSTLFDDGTINNLIIGAIVELDLVQSGDLLVATKVDFENQLDAPDNLEFKVEGETSFMNGELSVNGISFTTGSLIRLEDGLTLTSGALNGQWLELSGKHINSQFVLKRIRTEDKDSEISLEGLVENNTIWGYTASDNSLAQFNGQWVDIECQRTDSANSSDLTLCRLDVD
ncbi:DUF5666 domain-containing protein [Photobacterium sp. MCCC 1A19761]|uniref:DUF5666 domain-containing protein n=1 Tax=Photobacterium sp. MCCC 1A19761 TaxID=3115000 RepID=UPI00307D0AF0